VINVALASNGSVATASSAYSGSYPVASVINGKRFGAWGAGEGWNDNTISTFPDWVQVDFSGAKGIDRIDVFTLQEDYTHQVDPTLDMTFISTGVTAFQVQYWTGSAWADVPGGNVTGNNKVWRQFSFPTIRTTKIRVNVTATAGGTYSRLIEIEAWSEELEGLIQKLDPGALIELFELDTSSMGGSIDRFHAGTNESRAPIVWQGNTYSPWPVQAEGFEMTGRGTLPTPSLKVANIAGTITALNLAYDDMIGAKITRKRTFARYLDGQPGADATAAFPDDVYYVERKVMENRVMVHYALSSVMDVEGVMIPKRQVLSNLCGWRYRGPDCGYAGGAVATNKDVATAVLGLDDCSKRLSGCKLRFGPFGPLPYGGFLGANRY
jgi:lambda family phage minor tail protein L